MLNSTRILRVSEIYVFFYVFLIVSELMNELVCTHSKSLFMCVRLAYFHFFFAPLSHDFFLVSIVAQQFKQISCVYKKFVRQNKIVLPAKKTKNKIPKFRHRNRFYKSSIGQIYKKLQIYAQIDKGQGKLYIMQTHVIKFNFCRRLK